VTAFGPKSEMKNDDEQGEGVTDDASNAPQNAVTDVMAQLFGQPTTALGEYLGGPEDFFRRLQEAEIAAQHENIRNHIQNVVNATGRKPKLTAGQIPKFRLWAKIAANIPSTDAALSAIIEAALLNLFDSAETSANEEVAGALDNQTARLLLTAPEGSSIEPGPTGERGLINLATLGLISRPYRANLFGQFVFFIIGIGLGLATLFELILPYGSAFLPKYIPSSLGSDLVIDGIVISAVMVASVIALRARKYWLTELGKSVRETARPFYNHIQTQPKRALLSSIFKRPASVAFGLSFLVVCVVPVLSQVLPRSLRYNQDPPVVILTPPPQALQPDAVPNNAASPAIPPTSAPARIEITADKVQKLIEFWRSISNQLDAAIDAQNGFGVIIKDWVDRVRELQAENLLPPVYRQRLQSEVQALNNNISVFDQQIDQRRSSLESLAKDYEKYPNVSEVLNPTSIRAVFNPYYQAIENYRKHSLTIMDPTQTNFSSEMKPFSTGIGEAQTKLENWATETRNFANKQIKDLEDAQARLK
jgi:hypothetical protein